MTTEPVAGTTTVQIIASGLQAEQQATLTVLPPQLSSLTLTPAAVQGGTTAKPKGTVALTGPAPAGFTVTLSTSPPDSPVASVPPSITVPEKKLPPTAEFDVTTKAVSQTTTVEIIASRPGVSKKAPLTINPPPPTLDHLELVPTEVVQGNPATGTVMLTSKAPANGLRVDLSSSSPTVATVDTHVMVPAGETRATFTVSTKPGSFPLDLVSVRITATHGQNHREAFLTVTKPPPTKPDFPPIFEF